MTPWFASALTALRAGAPYSLCGMTLTVNGVTMAITEAQFDEVYDLLDELEGDDFTVRTPS